MRSANLAVTGSIATFATLLTVYAYQSSMEELHFWVMRVGIFAGAALISWFFFSVILSFRSNKTKGQVFILLGYGVALILSLIAGGGFGAVYYVMGVEKIDFVTAFEMAGMMIILCSTISMAILAGVLWYLFKQSRLPESLHS